MKILLFCHQGLIREYGAYIRALKKNNSVQSLLLTMGHDESVLARELGVFDVVKDILPGKRELDVAEKDVTTANDFLSALESRIGSKFVNQDILMDRFFRVQPLLNVDSSSIPLIWTGTRTKQFMYLISSRLEDVMKSFAPDFLFLEPSIAPTRMAWRLAHERGIPAGSFMSVRFWPERLYLEIGIGYDWIKARVAYDEIAAVPMVGTELTKVEERLKFIRETKTKPAYLQTEHAKGAPGFFRKLYALRAISGHGSWLGKRAQTSDRDPQVLPSNTYSPYAKFMRYRKGLEAKRFLLKHQTDFDTISKSKYAIYFLHVQPEITVEGMAFDFQDQIETLRRILSALPANMSLVVKEHTPMLGYRPLNIYNQLIHMPGIIICNTQEDSHRLIIHSSVVVTLTGTVALEALLYGIPAIVLGSIYFDSFRGIYKPKCLEELKRLLSNPNALRGATDDDALRALGSLLRASQPGKPSRVDVSASEIDDNSANVMASELKRVSRFV